MLRDLTEAPGPGGLPTGAAGVGAAVVAAWYGGGWCAAAAAADDDEGGYDCVGLV